MMKEIKYKKGRCIFAIYYDVSYDNKGSIRLWIEDRNHSELFLSNLIVQEAYRKQGIGKSLLRYSELAAKKLGIHQIALKVVSGSWMEDWYKRSGFIEDYKYEEDRLVTYLHKTI